MDNEKEKTYFEKWVEEGRKMCFVEEVSNVSRNT